MEIDGEILIVIHLHYFDLWPELQRCIQVVRSVAEADVWVTVTDPNLLRKLPRTVNGLIVENRGRDVGALFALLPCLKPHYKFWLKLHSKKSPHLHPAHGQKWRRTLCETLAGSPQRVHRCLAALNMPRVGIVTSRSHLAEGSDSNAPNVRALLGRTGVHDFDTHGTWAAGTMFWARSEILRFWKRMEICQSDFEPEPYAVDGFLGHAWERAVSPHARAALGLETVGI